ncbi:glycoside hydrolase family 65 protein [Sporosarcina pasteurii]|uniref:Kojibiose phosphorylase n=1 Tax=Sporosarcina pasteurii TaxID=1474 RepID=A0A380BDP3_SPOPA|nr:glycosyl hydrolase family 65 protein [Sporosarcina pasteurii]MDS9472467.1 glycosyl hydrolase family 65 protein [Sporosarcina pasteurii]QBQ06023.1 glycoside hydrolase family 65 protein [Sporosarcina pasteurii]SUI99656.1 Kojibiose phosphorylase [Sporosarcina pasteurii]
MLDYSQGKGEFKNWIISEVDFSSNALGKCEAIMSLGNGYMGLRSVTEEPYIHETRNLFVSGTFNKAAENEVTELPNLADVTRLDIRIDGERFSLELGQTNNYVRQLNLKTAELIRSFEWTSPKGKELRFLFSRFVSLDNLHLIGMKMEIESLTDPVEISIDTGINAQMSNSGCQHFLEGERRIYNNEFIQLIQTTTESNIDVVLNTTHKMKVNGKEASNDSEMHMARRKVWQTYQFNLKPNDKLEMEKLTTVHTSRDKEIPQEGYDLQKLRDDSLRALQSHVEKGYDTLFQRHKDAWQRKIWDKYNFELVSDNDFDELALRFSLYHLTVMTPAHDERMGIGAKALSGEGYKGHSFWDTEIFILPFFIFSNPEVAKSLLMYRYHGLEGARRKALENGYEGAMYPWEMAWPTDGEVTPEFGDIDIVTGEQTKIWTGFIEQHITSDIAFGVYQYENVTGDKQFMDEYGYEIVFDTAKFWASRLEWNEEKHRYEINNVIGPDEYKEHIHNNAFTNYMAYFNMKLAMRYYDQLKKENPLLLQSLGRKLDLDEMYSLWEKKAKRLYLPNPREEDSVIPQDDTYLQLKQIDLTKYKEQDTVRTIYRDYNPEQINEIQVTKQADTLILFYLLEQTFLADDERISEAVKRANFHYYEPRTLHDSSLSLVTYAIVANDIGEEALAYRLFEKSCETDLGPMMHTSDEGIHAASIGGIWKTAIFGFAGIRLVNGKLTIQPRLPKHWKEIKFTIHWQGQPINFCITPTTLTVEAVYKEKFVFESYGKTYECGDFIEVDLSEDVIKNS